MVFVNSQKFACESCIKGHRSSSCHHTDRPLFEIKKKGRPVTQCERCRELRKNKHMHVKCTCVDTNSAQSNSGSIEYHDDPRPTLRRPGQRKIPTTPTLPNGLSDLASQHVPNPSEDMHPKQRVDALLNPCNCKSVWKCRCPDRYGKHPKNTVSREKDNELPDPSIIVSRSKSCYDDFNVEDSSLNSGHVTLHGTKAPTPTASSHREERRLASIPYTPSSYTSPDPFDVPRPDEEPDFPWELALPPLKRSKTGGSDVGETSPLPSLTDVYPSPQDAVDRNALAVTSLTQCGCGSTCTCPGCKQHRGKDLAAQSGEDCPDKCGSCIDHMGGIALPTPSSITHTANNSCSHVTGPHNRSGTQGTIAGISTLDHFYAIAALLPPPPSHAHPPGMLDPTNVAVYQQSSGRKQDWDKVAGLTQVPPLNCCDGKCKCPGGMCGCGTKCGGRCGNHGINVGNADETAAANVDTEITEKENGDISEMAGCCGGKNANTERASKSSKKILRL